ncbi:putative nucleotidyltransferase-like protein [Ruminiclostridium sufflavum DSM 19573]|uniref:Putative nucleotidyltransferase-like protein n=1 Tax=Ruminiclostridium sufflavum DSM 19573 TaxID=1121337 RepID=A0A318XNZ7_9FIRM|nr:nucleotidyltransferase family protein [Ruminiclostridium sufflavum]PYG89486.1 putative nucleotidyltransferase-like protein [Ruminiclostridium sufflavum DSM 19573]
MTAKDRLLTEILRTAIYSKEFYIDKSVADSINWEEIYKEARAHQVHTLIYPVIKQVDPSMGPDDKLMAVWNISVMSCGIQMICDEIWLGEVIENLAAAGIDSIVLKGMAINKCYPYPELRTMGDADILVHEEDMVRAAEVLERLGYFGQRDTKTKHIEFFKKNSITIELHRLLIDYDFMRYKESFHDEIWKNRVSVNLGTIKANILSWEMQILHICIHMASHISHGGFGLRQLCDLVIVTEAKRNEINWNIVRDRSIKYGIDNFVYAIFLACNRIFEMEVPPEIAFRSIREHGKIDKLIEDILAGGNMGRKDIYRTSANVLLNNSSTGGELKYRSKFSKAVHLLFPDRNKLVKRKKYMYVRRTPLFLPLAWMHRIAYGVKRKDFSFHDKKEIFRNSELNLMAEERNNLLEWLGLR